MSHSIDPQHILDNALLFARMTSQVICDMLGHTCIPDYENGSDESFVRLTGLAVLIHFGGCIQGDYILHLSEDIAARLSGRECVPMEKSEYLLFQEEIADLFSEILNTVVGQTINSLEETQGILSYVPAVTVLGAIHFPRVLSRSFMLKGSAGPIRCILSLNMGDLRIARRMDEMKENLDVKTRQAHVDRLTQLYNRSFYDEVFATYVAEVERYHNVLSLMIIDIDNFKLVNDRYGHQTGDVVLSIVGGIIRRVVRKCDIPVRYGGDEICVIMPETDEKGARRAAERIAEELAARSIECIKDGEKVTVVVTLSVGVGQHTAGETAEVFFARTDLLLYAAKDQGRARIVCAADAETPARLEGRE